MDPRAEEADEQLDGSFRENAVTTLEPDEFDTFVNRLKSGKACGSDRLKAEAIIYADEGTKNNIRIMFEKCLNGNPIPEEWREVRIWPIH